MTRPSSPFLAALGGLYAPPCEYPARCLFYDVCREGAACAAFDRYLTTRYRQVVREPDERPSRSRYRRLFPGRDHGAVGTEGRDDAEQA